MIFTILVGHNESAVSFAWVSKNSFVVGLASRQIKLYDISGEFSFFIMFYVHLVGF